MITGENIMERMEQHANDGDDIRDDARKIGVDLESFLTLPPMLLAGVVLGIEAERERQDEMTAEVAAMHLDDLPTTTEPQN